MSEESPREDVQAADAVSNGDGANGAITSEQVLDALRVVVDPELGISIVDLGLVYDVQVEDGRAVVTYTLTSMGCPVGPLIEQQMQAVVSALPGIESLESHMTFDPPWSTERMSEDARMAMGMF